jgi:hypothetical protein
MRQGYADVGNLRKVPRQSSSVLKNATEIKSMVQPRNQSGMQNSARVLVGINPALSIKGHSRLQGVSQQSADRHRRSHGTFPFLTTDVLAGM